MNPSIHSREDVAHHLSISTKTLLRFEGRGLVRPIRLGDLEGYGPAEIRRIWTILTFWRDLGINMAGIEVILGFRDQMSATQAELQRLAIRLEETLEEREEARPGPDVHG